MRTLERTVRGRIALHCIYAVDLLNVNKFCNNVGFYYNRRKQEQMAEVLKKNEDKLKSEANKAIAYKGRQRTSKQIWLGAR